MGCQSFGDSGKIKGIFFGSQLSIVLLDYRLFGVKGYRYLDDKTGAPV